jgi:hypothetical protein
MKVSFFSSIILLVSAGITCAQNPAESPRAHAEPGFVIHLQAPPAEVFPLFGPAGEREWSQQWSPRIIFPSDGSTPVAGAVFSTADEHGDQTWVLTAYDPQQGHIRYCIFLPGLLVTEIDIHLQRLGEAQTSAEVLYRHTALSAEGDRLVTRMGKHHGAMGPHWEHAINEALRKRRENASR